MSKGEQTKEKILHEAMSYSSIYGLASVTIGEISKRLNMSRTGVISHFKDKEDMQLSILKYSEEKYIENVVIKSRHEDSLKRLKDYFKCWRDWISTLEVEYEGGSCPFIKAIIEYQDREPSRVQEYITSQQAQLLSYIAQLVKRCVMDGYFRPDTDVELFAFQAYSYYFGHNVSRILTTKEQAKAFSKKALNQLITNSLVS